MSTPTPFQEIYDIFESKFQSSTVLPDGLELQWLKSAISDFYLSLGKELELDLINQNIITDISRPEKELLGKIMYKKYLERERDKMSKIANFIGKDIKFTSYADKQRTFKELVEKIDKEINDDAVRIAWGILL